MMAQDLLKAVLSYQFPINRLTSYSDGLHVHSFTVTYMYIAKTLWRQYEPFHKITNIMDSVKCIDPDQANPG